MDQAIPPAVKYFILVGCGGLGLLMLLWRPGPRWWIGVRLPWTFADRQLWDKSWRLAAMFLLGMGIGIMVSFKFFLIGLIHLTVLALLYPIVLYRFKYGTWRYWKDLGWLDYHPAVRCAHCGHIQKLRDENDLPVAVCEACGLMCRSRQLGSQPLSLLFQSLRRTLATLAGRPPKDPPQP